MTNQRAIEIITGLADRTPKYSKGKIISAEQDKEIVEALKMTVELLRKQTPRKPVNIDDWGEVGQCPSCGRDTFWHLNAYYCEGCGQLIDWGMA